MGRNAGDYVKSWGAALIRGAASNPEFTVIVLQLSTIKLCKSARTCNDKDLFRMSVYDALPF